VSHKLIAGLLCTEDKMMGKSGNFILHNLAEMVSAGFLIVTTTLVVINVILRYIFSSGITWSEEAATGCFVWSVFIGAAAIYKHRGHIGVDMVVNLLPALPKRILGILMDILLTVLNGYLSYLAFLYIMTSHTKMTPVMGISSAYISSSVLISFILMTVYSVQFVYQDFTKPQVKEGETK
jgi:TRAP-type C4-dicarboxylate transport system permease small subunit